MRPISPHLFPLRPFPKWLRNFGVKMFHFMTPIEWYKNVGIKKP